MNNDKNHINYTAADIQNYLLGKLPANEMHAIEKAALNNPLLADAIEGYEKVLLQNGVNDFININNDLKSLKTSITNFKPTSPVTFMPNHWWKYAAAVLVLTVGIVFTIYQYNLQPDKNTTIAQNIPQKKDTQTIIQTDTIQSVVEPKIPTTVVTPTDDVQKKDVDIKMYPSNNSNYTQEKANTKLPVIKTEANISPLTIADKNEIDPENNSVENIAKKDKKSIDQQQIGYKNVIKSFSGKIIGENNDVVPYAKITINKNQYSKTDANGVFYLTSPDSTLQLDILAANYLPATVQLAAGKPQNILLSAKKTSIKQSKTSSKNDRHSQIILLSKKGLEPKDGWLKYEKYLINQLSFSRYDDGRLVDGETICSFEVDANSEVINFQFEKSINEEVNEAVKELIKFGPEWKITNTKTNTRVVKLKIIF